MAHEEEYVKYMKEQAKGVLENIMRMVEKLHHAQTCNGGCPLTQKGIIEGLGYSYAYHNKDAIVKEIYDTPLSFHVSSGWTPAEEFFVPINYVIVMMRLGPAVKITGRLDEDGVPKTADLKYYDLYIPWTKYVLEEQEQEAVLEFAQHFSYSCP